MPCLLDLLEDWDRFLPRRDLQERMIAGIRITTGDLRHAFRAVSNFTALPRYPDYVGSLRDS
jgi:hypothetical protein